MNTLPPPLPSVRRGDAQWQVIAGDCLSVLPTLPIHSAHALVTDPPAGISFMGKDWDHNRGGRDDWIEWLMLVMIEARRVLYPGAHALVWALPRTAHWTATALENAGFEIRDVGVHLFGEGFPKSLDVSKAIDRAAGAEREILGIATGARNGNGANNDYGTFGSAADGMHDVTMPATEAARQWEGWGTALKPAAEHWILARAPMAEKTVAGNVQRYGTGALHVDACRIDGNAKKWESPRGGICLPDSTALSALIENPQGRWPANVTLDEEAAAALDAQTGVLTSGYMEGIYGKDASRSVCFGFYNGAHHQTYGDSGGASRFFYTAKASSEERNRGLDAHPFVTTDDGRQTPIDNPYLRGETVRRNHHPTVKPIALMQWLCRLITPPGGTVLDPFAGSGTTGIAALREGFSFVGIEQNAEYVEIARKRIIGDAPLLNMDSAVPDAE